MTQNDIVSRCILASLIAGSSIVSLGLASAGASGLFTVDRLAPGTVTGALSQGAIPLYVQR